MIRFAAKFQQLATPRGEDFTECHLKVFEQVERQRLGSVLRHENHV
ncbi:hypothetical protein P3F88_30175 [Paraburkholderia phenoliruptrix]|nr:hypothetical protein [Paraburkholderia phenoliruptrix]WMY10948.1 hypothetical protein P3F88_30175 [Paraburkholderia phenoliruptrix]